MKLKQKMMINAYSTYLIEKVDTVNSYSTRSSYLEQAKKYYNNSELADKPPHLADAEQEIGFTKQ